MAAMVTLFSRRLGIVLEPGYDRRSDARNSRRGRAACGSALRIVGCLEELVPLVEQDSFRIPLSHYCFGQFS
ncbi:MAG: hypothetical protein J4N95_03360 [Chloroflexi bacterium]|nr:hypothetical protein [Chloroflexota bacterium]